MTIHLTPKTTTTSTSTATTTTSSAMPLVGVQHSTLQPNLVPTPRSATLQPLVPPLMPQPPRATARYPYQLSPTATGFRAQTFYNTGAYSHTPTTTSSIVYPPTQSIFTLAAPRDLIQEGIPAPIVPSSLRAEAAQILDAPPYAQQRSYSQQPHYSHPTHFAYPQWLPSYEQASFYRPQQLEVAPFRYDPVIHSIRDKTIQAELVEQRTLAIKAQENLPYNIARRIAVAHIEGEYSRILPWMIEDYFRNYEGRAAAQPSPVPMPSAQFYYPQSPDTYPSPWITPSYRPPRYAPPSYSAAPSRVSLSDFLEAPASSSTFTPSTYGVPTGTTPDLGIPSSRVNVTTQTQQLAAANPLSAEDTAAQPHFWLEAIQMGFPALQMENQQWTPIGAMATAKKQALASLAAQLSSTASPALRQHLLNIYRANESGQTSPPKQPSYLEEARRYFAFPNFAYEPVSSTWTPAQDMQAEARRELEKFVLALKKAPSPQARIHLLTARGLKKDPAQYVAPAQPEHLKLWQQSTPIGVPYFVLNQEKRWIPIGHMPKQLHKELMGISDALKILMNDQARTDYLIQQKLIPSGAAKQSTTTNTDEADAEVSRLFETVTTGKTTMVGDSAFQIEQPEYWTALTNILTSAPYLTREVDKQTGKVSWEVPANTPSRAEWEITRNKLQAAEGNLASTNAALNHAVPRLRNAIFEAQMQPKEWLYIMSKNASIQPLKIIQQQDGTLRYTMAKKANNETKQAFSIFNQITGPNQYSKIVNGLKALSQAPAVDPKPSTSTVPSMPMQPRAQSPKISQGSKMGDDKPAPKYQAPKFATPTASPTPVAKPKVVDKTDYTPLPFAEHIPGWRFAMMFANLPAMVEDPSNPDDAILDPRDQLLEQVLMQLNEVSPPIGQQETPEDYGKYINVLFNHGLLSIADVQLTVRAMQEYKMIGAEAQHIPASIQHLMMNSQHTWWRPAINLLLAPMMVNSETNFNVLELPKQIQDYPLWQQLASQLANAKTKEDAANIYLATPLRKFQGVDLLEGKEAELRAMEFSTLPTKQVAPHPLKARLRADRAIAK